MAPTALLRADIWHKRLGHMNPRHMELLRKVDGNGVDYTGAVTDCDICKVCKIVQKAHPRKDSHQTNGPMELVYRPFGTRHTSSKGRMQERQPVY